MPIDAILEICPQCTAMPTGPSFFLKLGIAINTSDGEIKQEYSTKQWLKIKFVRIFIFVKSKLDLEPFFHGNSSKSGKSLLLGSLWEDYE